MSLKCCIIRSIIIASILLLSLKISYGWQLLYRPSENISTFWDGEKSERDTAKSSLLKIKSSDGFMQVYVFFLVVFFNFDCFIYLSACDFLKIRQVDKRKIS